MCVIYDHFCSIETFYALRVLRVFNNALVRRDTKLLRSAISINSDVVSKRVHLNEYVAYCNLRFKNELQCRELVPKGSLI